MIRVILTRSVLQFQERLVFHLPKDELDVAVRGAAQNAAHEGVFSVGDDVEIDIIVVLKKRKFRHNLHTILAFLMTERCII